MATKADPSAQLLRLIREAQPKGDNAITAPQLADIMGCGIGKARATAHRLVAEGKLRSVQTRRPNVHGVVQSVWAFEVVA